MAHTSRDNTEQDVLNAAFDDEFRVLKVRPYGSDGTSLQSLSAGGMAVKITVSGTSTYIGKAAPGSAQASAVWQAMKIDESSGTVITWADSNVNFDNVATDLTSLSYS